jgi:hypothetical protein
MNDRNSLANLPTHQELENARTKGQVIGWVQGAGAVVVFGLVLNFVGWIPLIAIAGVGAYVGYRVLFGRSKE